MTRWILTLALACGAVAAHAQTAAAAAPSCDAAFDAFAASQNVDRAIAGYEACLTTAPKTARYNLGVLYAGRQDWTQAIEEFDEFLKLDANSSRAPRVRAEIERLRHLRTQYPTPEAVQQYRHDQLLLHSRQFLRAGLNDEAELLGLRAAEVSGGTFDDFVALAAAASARKDFDLALRRLDEAEAAAPAGKKGSLAGVRASVNKELTVATLRKSAEASLKTDPRRAAELLMGAWRMAPDRVDIGFAAAIAYLATSDPQHAVPILDKLSSGPDADLAARARKLRVDLGALLVKAGELRALEGRLLGDLLKSTGRKKWTDLSSRDFARVEAALADGVSKHPDGRALRHHYAFVLARQQKWSEAEAQYREMLRREPNAPVQFWLARVLYREHKYDESRLLLEADLRRGDDGTPATTQLKTFLAEDLSNALRTTNK